MQRPVTWGAILVFGLLWNLAPWSLGMGLPSLQEAAFPFCWGFVFLVLSPVPWQWTGDETLLAPMGRGVLQALPWNALWTLGLLLLMGISRPEHLPRGDRHPRRTEASVPAEEAGPIPGLRHLPESLHGAPGQPPLPPRLLVLGAANLSFGMLLGWILADKERAEAGESAAVRVLGETRARALQSQMNPHVLFNAISGLTELVREDPDAAEKALVSLSGLLRHLLDYSARRLAPLASERTLVEQYLALQQIRLGKRLRVAWEWEEAVQFLEVPPLLLQPLVENALKHGIGPHRGGGDLRIVLRTSGAGLELEVANTGRALPESYQEGIGLKNLKERLELFLPGSKLRLFREGEWTRAILELKGAQS
jgi:hypothetical protein